MATQFASAQSGSASARVAGPARYASVQPQNNTGTYGPGTVVDFKISAAGSKIKAGSLRISGQLNAYASGGTAPTAADVMFFDRLLGVQGLFSQVSVATDNQGTLESMMRYPRDLRMIREQNTDSVNFATDSRYISEGCALTDAATVFNLMQANYPFSCRPTICINKTSADISLAATGDITLSIRLSIPTEAFHAGGAAINKSTTWGYSISQLELSFMLVPDVPVPPKDVIPVTIGTVHSLQMAMNSETFAFNSPVPVSALTALSVTFIETTHINSGQYNCWASEVPAGTVSKVEVSVADQLYGGYLTYELRSQEEIQAYYQKSISGKGMFSVPKYNALSLESRTENPSITALNTDQPALQGYGVGFWFGESTPLDAQRNPVGLRLTSGASAAPCTAYLMFHGLRTL